MLIMRRSLFVSLIALLGIASIAFSKNSLVPNKFYSYQVLYHHCHEPPAASFKSSYMICLAYTNSCALKNIKALMQKRHGEQKASLKSSYQTLNILVHSLCTNYTVGNKYLYGHFKPESDDYTTQSYLEGVEEACRQSFIMTFINNIKQTAPVDFKFQCRYNPDHQS